MGMDGPQFQKTNSEIKWLAPLGKLKNVTHKKWQNYSLIPIAYNTEALIYIYQFKVFLILRRLRNLHEVNLHEVNHHESLD